jgi:hypothetical protein
MATIMSVDEDTFAAMAYPSAPAGFSNFVQNQMALTSNSLSAVGQTLFRNAMQTYEHSLLNPARRIAAAALRQIQSLWGTDSYQYLDEIFKVQNAPPKMIPFIMVHDAIRNLYQQQRCDGFDGKYFDIQPNVNGWDNMHYQAIFNGVVNVEDSDDGGWHATTASCSEDDRFDKVLSFDDQVDIINTFKVVDHAISLGKDPTSIWDQDLG